MRTDHFLISSREEYLAYKKENSYIQDILGVDKCETTLPPDTCISEQDETNLVCDEQKASVTSSNKGSPSSSDDEKSYEKINSFDLTGNDDINGCDMKELIEKFNFLNLPLDLQRLLPGIYHCLPNDYTIPIDKKPDWFDEKKFKIGQAFTQKYFVGLNASDMLSLIVLFAFPDDLEPLIFSGNSGSPFTAFRRYLSTVLRVTSWYDHDIWSKDNPGYINLKKVRALHLNVSKRLNSAPYEDIKNKITLCESSDKPLMWTTKKDLLLKDFQSGCPFKTVKPFDNKRPGKVFITQLDMSITQFAFVGLLATYPEKFGAGSATKEELEGFLHLWRSIGYLLGIEDRFNFCTGTLEEVVQRCHSVIDYWVKPNFQHITEDWEHMSRCLTEGLTYYLLPSVSFESTIMYLCWIMEIPMPNLMASLSWTETFVFHFIKFAMTVLLTLPGVLPIANWLLRYALARASSMTPEELKKLEGKKHEYQIAKVFKSEETEENKFPGASLLALLSLARLLI